MWNRLLIERLKASRKSILLLGPRQTGKSTLIAQLNPDLSLNLGHEATYLRFLRNPDELEERIGNTSVKSVLIDEVQRLPSLLNTVQVLIDERKLRFFLTGSSARKLRRGKANLLPGRIHSYGLGPLSCVELGKDFVSKDILRWGSLPGVLAEPDVASREKTLSSYVSTYLKEEIQAESLIRKLEGFSRFIFVAATAATQYLDMVKLANEAQVPRNSAQRYFEVLEDTLIVHRLCAFSKSLRKRLIQHPKFFFFDTGVLNALLENFECSGDRMGMLLEHTFQAQLNALALGLDKSIRVSSYRTENDAEVDFIVEGKGFLWAIETKGSQNIGPRALTGLKSFQKYYGKSCRLLLAHNGNIRRTMGDVELLPWWEIIGELARELGWDA